MIDHIIATTKSPQITYIGFSQGSIAFLAMSCIKPEYNKKIKLANLLAPVTAFYPIKSIVFKVWSLFNYFVEVKYLQIISENEENNKFVSTFLNTYHSTHSIAYF